MQRLYDKMAFYDNLHFLKKYRFAKKEKQAKQNVLNYVIMYAIGKYGSSAEISEYFSKMKY